MHENLHGVNCHECSRPLSKGSRSREYGNVSWWCRDCAFSVCCDCHLLKGHDDHRGAEWSTNEVASSCIRYLQERSERRSERYQEDKASISKFIRALEKMLIDAYQTRYDQMEYRDDQKVIHLQSAFGLSKDFLKPMREFLQPTRKPSLKVPVETRLERGLNQLCALDASCTLVENLHAIDEAAGYSSDIQDNGLLFFNPEVIVNVIKDQLFIRLDDFKNKSNVTDVMPITPNTSNLTSFTSPTSGNLTSFASPMTSGRQSTGYDSPDSRRSTASSVPIEPRVTILTNGNRADNESFFEQNLIPEIQSNVDARRSFKRISGRAEPPARPKSLESTIVQTDPVRFAEPKKPVKDFACQVDLMHASSLSPDAISVGYQNSIPPSPNSIPPSPNGSYSGRTSRTSDEQSVITVAHSSSVITKDIGARFLSRPMDVAFMSNLGEGMIAISDSCGGVYLATREGAMVYHIWTGGGSASSLSYVPKYCHLFVSVLQNNSQRSILIYDVGHGSTNQPIGSTPCPTEPKVESARTRWIDTTSEGDLFMVAGDNNMSAIWMQSRHLRQWSLIHKAKHTRFQYISLIEDNPVKGHVSILTGEALKSRIYLFRLSDSLKIVKQIDMSARWGLSDAVQSIASVVFDPVGMNILILDYFTGSLWIVRPDTGAGPVVEPLLTMGHKEALGMATSNDGWCYIACLTSKRVKAVRYAI